MALFCIACAAYWAWRRKNMKTTEPPYFPGGWPILGHAPALIGDSCSKYFRLVIRNRTNTNPSSSFKIIGFYIKSI